MGNRTSPTQGPVDAVPAAPGQRGCDHAGQDERDPDQLPGPSLLTAILPLKTLS
jgi:hypothetical protein